jgi:hypothetical protein
MEINRYQRLLAREAMRSPSSAIDRALSPERMEIMTYLADRRPYENTCKAITRLLGVSPRAVLTDDCVGHWGAILLPLREL